jgi:hypothetical protein
MASLRRLFRLRNIIVLLILGGGVVVWRVAFQPTAAAAEVGRTEHTVAASSIEDILLVNGLVKPSVND